MVPADLTQVGLAHGANRSGRQLCPQMRATSRPKTVAAAQTTRSKRGVGRVLLFFLMVHRDRFCLSAACTRSMRTQPRGLPCR